MTTSTNAETCQLANVRLFKRKGENDLHWFLRDVLMNHCKALQMGVTEFLEGTLKGSSTLPPCFLLDDWVASVSDMYKPEITSCMASLTPAQIASLTPQTKLCWIMKQLIHKMMISHKVLSK